MNEKIIIKLHEIYYKLGAYNTDNLTHAQNVIESNSTNAKEIMKILKIKILDIDDFYKLFSLHEEG